MDTPDTTQQGDAAQPLTHEPGPDPARRGRTFRRTALAGAVALALTAGLAAAWPDGSHASAAPTGVTWEDDFDGAAGSAPDPAKWTHEVNGDGGGNGELQYYTDRTENASLDGRGSLVITARKENPADYQCHYGRCEYTSARLNTSKTFKQRYGRFEARIKIPRGQGMWPAFWMLGGDFPGTEWPDCGEIDILENIGSEPSRVHGSLHGPGYSGGSPVTGSFDHPEGRAFADDFHTFAVEWSPGSIAWFVDGREYQRKTPADAGGNPWPYDQEFFMILNLAVGGSWPGPPDGSTRFPQRMLVDYVRVSSPGS